MSDRTNSFAANQAAQRDDMATVVSTIDKQQTKYADILPSSVPWADFRNAFLVAVQQNYRLLQADRQSLFLALQKAASDGLKPDGREGALVIFGDDKEDEEGNPVPSVANAKKKVQWMPMVAGLIKLVRNTGKVANIRAKLIYKGEQVVISDEDGQETYKHVRTIGEGTTIDDDPSNIIGAYAVVKYKDGDWEIEPMTRRQIDRVRAVSKAKKGPWAPWYDEMAKKTVLRRLIKRLEKSSELRALDAVLERDETMTIDGVATEATDPIRQEFSPEKQATKSAAATNVKAQRQPARQEAPHDPETGEIKAAKESFSGKPAFDQAKQQAAAEAEMAAAARQMEPDVEIWPADENGEPLEDCHEPMSAVEFAKWYAGRLSVTKHPEALFEHNADNAADAGGNEEARAIIQTAIDLRQQADKPAVQAAPVVAATRKPIVAIPIPVTPKNAPHWPHYEKLVREAIPQLKSLEEVDTWEAMNKPNYDRRAIQIAIENWLRDRRRALGFKEQPDEVIPETSEQIMSRVFTTVSLLTTDDAITEWTKGTEIVATMAGLRKNDRPAFDKIVAFIDNRRLELPVA